MWFPLHVCPECIAPAGDSRCYKTAETNLARYYYFYHSNQTEKKKKRMEIKWRKNFVANLRSMLMYWKQVIVTVLQKKIQLDRATYCSLSHKIEPRGAILLGTLSRSSLLYAMGQLTFKENVPSLQFSRIMCSRVASKGFSSQC